MRDEMIDKLRKALAGPIRGGQDVVYILAQSTKIMDRDKIPETTFPNLRNLRNWALHETLSNKVIRQRLQFLDSILRPLYEGKTVSTQKKAEATKLLTLVPRATNSYNSPDH